MNHSGVGLLALAALLSIALSFVDDELDALRARVRVEPRRVDRSDGHRRAEARVDAGGSPELLDDEAWDEPGEATVESLDPLRPALWPSEPVGVVPGEFETQGALLLSCRELVPSLPELFARIVAAARESIPIAVLVSDDVEREFVESTLDDHGLSRGSVRFLTLPHDTKWVRDYGPVTARAPGGSIVVLDAEYRDDTRLKDDEVPAGVARLLGLRHVAVPIEVDGGNLLSNGEGICLSTLELVAENEAPASEVRRALAVYYGCETTVMLEALIGEDTGHVDMFATFTSADTVVVGSYDPVIDLENAELLDRNADVLRQVETRRQSPLRVVRIPMPTRSAEVWKTFTNVIYANGRLMVPVHSDDDPRDRARALLTYSMLLPGWEMVPIDVDDLVDSGGALHCISRNLTDVLHDRPSTPRDCEPGESAKPR